VHILLGLAVKFRYCLTMWQLLVFLQITSRWVFTFF